jgi:hypothetical protein
MTQADRDRLVTPKKARKKLITQREAAEELGVSIRQVCVGMASDTGCSGTPSRRGCAEPTYALNSGWTVPLQFGIESGIYPSKNVRQQPRRYRQLRATPNS